MDAKYLEEIKAAKKALNEEIRFYKHDQKDLDNRSPMDAQDSYSNGYSDAVVHVDQQIDGLNSALKLLAEVERLTAENDVLKSECKAHIRKQADLFKGYQQMKADNAAKDQALELANITIQKLSGENYEYSTSSFQAQEQEEKS